jgi:uncharacterized protein YqjF (DUF2071 family)
MSKIADILNTRSHRTYPLPDKPWKQYQQWHENLLMHWKVPSSALSDFIPKGLTIDTFDKQPWVSIIAFSVKNLRPRFLPPLPLISNFHEVNFRTYVTRGGIPGIYFLSIEASKLLPALLARLFIGIPYIKSDINRSAGTYYAKNASQHLELKTAYSPLESLESRTALDYWLTERHALYQQNGSKLHRLDIHHKPWPLQHMAIDVRITGYLSASNALTTAPHLVHYAKRLDVVVWGRVTV